MRSRSIRFKITIVYMTILSLTLLFFSIILYHYLKRSLYDNMDALLQSKAEGIVHAISTYWAAERLGTKRYGAKPVEETAGGNIGFATIAQRWVQERSKDPKLLDIIVQIFDTKGTLIATSKNTQGITSVSRENFISVLEGKSLFDVLVPSFPTKKVVAFRVFITPATESDRVEYVVQVASPLASIQTALNSLKFILILLFPITVILTGMMGSLIAKLTLRPVDSIIKTINDIKAESLELRLSIPQTKDEIQKLAETFNDMLERLDKAFRSQKHLFEDLSHELKTPLTILKGEFEVVLKKVRSHGEYESILRSSLEEVDKLIRLVENLLILASFQSKNILPERRDLELNLLIQGVVNSIKKLAGQKYIETGVTLRDHMVVNGDEEQLKHLFLNLLDNAIKYTPANGRITVTAEEDAKRARIMIKDTGVGIPEEKLNRIFDRFYRVENVEMGKGFGLGLSIVKSIVAAHNGSIEVESHLGQGTTFTIYLPLSVK